jgi:hypothetical protein
VAYPGVFFGWGSTNSIEYRGQIERGSGGGQPPSQGFWSICKWVKPVFLLGCYGYIFHGTGNSAQLCQNFGIWGGGMNHPNPPNSPSVRHCSPALHLCNLLLFVNLMTLTAARCVASNGRAIGPAQ